MYTICSTDNWVQNSNYSKKHVMIFNITVMVQVNFLEFCYQTYNNVDESRKSQSERFHLNIEYSAPNDPWI
jgi:hypothetical protein